MARVEKTIEIDRPLRMVYDQWTQFEEFPRFMEGVEEVHQIDDRTLHWKAKIGGKTQEWTAEIVQQEPDESIAWRHTQGSVNSGVVVFTPIDGERCQLTLALEYDPKGFIEKAGDILGVVSRRVEGDLERFKKFIEERPAETGAWRGQVKPTGQVDPHPTGQH
jgi:uncharacterized membrane protein